MLTKTMKKADLINNVAEATGESKARSKVLVETVFSEIQKGVLANGSGTFLGFGNFKVVARKARVGRNPQTGKAIEIPAKNVVKFKPQF